MAKLTDKKIEWAVKQVINKGESTGMVAAICVSQGEEYSNWWSIMGEQGNILCLIRKEGQKLILAMMRSR
ncbi:MAG: hypothetical protein C5S38_03160 [Candidatus Methanophagaceae archaeon]|jgi:hypothetical protein|nr:MAG: hypothetical protein C5S38_03160 [Methanophagales archaeon]